jgi:hypothetical protein
MGSLGRQSGVRSQEISWSLVILGDCHAWQVVGSVKIVILGLWLAVSKLIGMTSGFPKLRLSYLASGGQCQDGQDCQDWLALSSIKIVMLG